MEIGPELVRSAEEFEIIPAGKVEVFFRAKSLINSLFLQEAYETS